jgi:hypothetical protein
MSITSKMIAYSVILCLGYLIILYENVAALNDKKVKREMMDGNDGRK